VRQAPSNGMRLRRQILVWLGVCVLALQTMIPGAAMTHDRAVPAIVMCAADGATIVADLPDLPRPRQKGFAGLACEQCLTASLTALPPPAPRTLVRAFAIIETVAISAPSDRRPPSRAPPRPPSQGPPVFA
jgi:hypothetical protein